MFSGETLQREDHRARLCNEETKKIGNASQGPGSFLKISFFSIINFLLILKKNINFLLI